MISRSRVKVISRESRSLLTGGSRVGERLILVEISDNGMDIPEEGRPNLLERRNQQTTAGQPSHIDMDIPDEGTAFPPTRIIVINNGRYQQNPQENPQSNTRERVSQFMTRFRRRMRQRNVDVGMERRIINQALMQINLTSFALFNMGLFTTKHILSKMKDFGVGLTLKRRYVHLISKIEYFLFLVSLILYVATLKPTFLGVWLVFEFISNIFCAGMRFFVHKERATQFTRFETIILMIELIPIVSLS